MDLPYLWICGFVILHSEFYIRHLIPKLGRFEESRMRGFDVCQGISGEDLRI